jgi:toxin ParE1/3/4
MTGAVVRLRTAARQDIAEAAANYRDSAGPAVAKSFTASIRAVISRIERHPSSGSARYQDVVGIPGLRFMAAQPFPYLVFYRLEGGRADVIRVLHQRQDAARRLSDT